MSELDKTVGRNIRVYRRARKLTLDELAAKVHKSRATMGKYEQGAISLDMDTLFEIARALELSPGELICAAEDGEDGRAFMTRPSDDEAASLASGGERKYFYFFDGRISRVVRSILATSPEEGNNFSALFYNLPSLDEPGRCRALYYGEIQRHEFVTNYLFENQLNKVEHLFLCMVKPLDYSVRETGLCSGLSTRTLLPIATKCIMSPSPIPEDEALVSELLLTKEDIRLTKKFNMFVIEQSGV